MKLFLIIFCAAIIPLNSVICDHYISGNLPTEIHSWWFMRMDLISFSWLCGAYSHKLKTPEEHKTLITFATSVWLGLAVADVFDKWTGNRGAFTLVDFLSVAGALASSYYFVYIKK